VLPTPLLIAAEAISVEWRQLDFDAASSEFREQSQVPAVANPSDASTGLPTLI